MRRIHIIALIIICLSLNSGCSINIGPETAGEDFDYLVSITDSRTYTPEQFCEVLGEAASKRLGSDIRSGYSESSENNDENGEGISLNAINRVVSNVSAINIPKMDRKYGKSSLFNRDHKWQIERHRFHYVSTSYAGEPIILSGVVTFPSTISGEPSEIDSYSLYSHYVLDTLTDAPTICDDIIFTRTFFNSAVIEADFEGYGCTSDRFFAGSMYDVLAKQEVDCAMAAVEIMKQRGVSLAEDGHSDSWGYSLGGPTALAVQGYIENDAPEKVVEALKFRSTFCGGGPFDVYEMIRYFDENPQYNRSLISDCTKLLNVLSKRELGGYDSREFWNEDSMNIVLSNGNTVFEQLFFIKDYYPIEWDGHYPSVNPEKGYEEWLFSSDMIKPNGDLDFNSTKTKILLKVVQKHSSLKGWQPVHPIYISHGVNDDMMPCPMTDKVVEDLLINDDGSANSFIHYWHTNLDLGPTISGTGKTHMAESFINIFNMISYESPEEMYRKSIRL